MLKSKLFQPLVTSALSLSLLAGSFSSIIEIQPVEAAKPKTAVNVTVKQVVDGDTIKVIYKGRQETVRMILIDTPETKHPKKCVQLYGPQASAYTKKYTVNMKKKVSVELDKDPRDQYGRLLAYVYVNNTMLNELLLQNGLAKITVFEPNTKYLKKLQATETKAKKAKAGIWSNSNAAKGACAPKLIKPVLVKPTPVKPVTKPAPLKSESFKNCTELRKKYPNGVKKGHPAYEAKHDRDKDGYACE